MHSSLKRACLDHSITTRINSNQRLLLGNLLHKGPIICLARFIRKLRRCLFLRATLFFLARVKFSTRVQIVKRYFFQVQRPQNVLSDSLGGLSMFFSLTCLPKADRQQEFLLLHLCPPCHRAASKKRQFSSHAPVQRLKVQEEIRCGHNYWFSLVRPFELLMSIVLSVTWRPEAQPSPLFAITIFTPVFRTASVPEQIFMRAT